MIPYFKKQIFEDIVFEPKGTQVLFFPDGSAMAGKVKAYIINSKQDKEYVCLFLGKLFIYSIIALVLSLSLFITVRPNIFLGWILVAAIAIPFRIIYTRKVKNLMDGF